MSLYQPTAESISHHKVPDWYHDAKLGIFVHYGLYSVPGWAVVSEGDITQTLGKMGWAGHLRVNPYAEWYLNTLRLNDSPTQKYHHEKFGSNFNYEDFVPIFNKANEEWDPAVWADLFSRIGAKYVVLTSKHCESFQLWPSTHKNPFKENYAARRDIVGELNDAVIAQGMRMGLYYCGGFDWTFNHSPISTAADIGLSIPQSPEYIEYCTRHWYELIDRYKPSIMWGDVGYPFRADVNSLFAYYYNNVSEGVINDRFYQVDPEPIKKLVRIPGLKWLIDKILTKAFLEGKTSTPSVHSDFTTPEYSINNTLNENKWETCRGLGYSFGYNRNETAEHMLSVKELVHMLVDIVSKNGNLLLNVGPKADGTISDLQLERLEGLGDWLAVNGEGIYGTRPWQTAEGQTDTGVDIRFTTKPNTLYAVLLSGLSNASPVIKDLIGSDDMKAHLLGYEDPIEWQQNPTGIQVSLPPNLPDSDARTLKLSPQPSSIS